MKNKRFTNKGFTIVEMVVVVIILILLAIIAIRSSKRTSLQAELANIQTEMSAVRTGVLKIHSEYNNGTIDDYTSGEHYNAIMTESDNTWYVIYGMNNPEYSKEIMENYGLSELKKDYRVDFDTAEVEFLNGPVKIEEYEITSYEDLMTLIESGVI